LAKSFGSANPHNVVKATFDALSKLKTPHQIAKMRGIESTAMLLAASDGKEGDEETVQLIDVPSSVPNGELLSFEGMPIGEPDVMLKSKGALKVWDRVKEKLRVNGNGEAVYQDEENTIRKIMSSDGPAKVSSLRDCMIG
jgi:tRNA-binding EMAP/Myf-like protein